jgi:hypothetical protein
VNLYGFVGNDGIGRVDYLGEKCSIDAKIRDSKPVDGKTGVVGEQGGIVSLEASKSGLLTDEDAKTYLEVYLNVKATLGIQTNSTSKKLTYSPDCIGRGKKKMCVVVCDNIDAQYSAFMPNDRSVASKSKVGVALLVTQKGCGTKKVSVTVRGVGLFTEDPGKAIVQLADGRFSTTLGNTHVGGGLGPNAELIGPPKQAMTGPLRYSVEAIGDTSGEPDDPPE